ncbi:uncharacterized protein PRCAT00000253001 [Priceomyces carsonii]|uniref:uncharacterized protein n=1 Tax=Priceomyces carsonii TaxID=28549 RepID=UPI002EDA11D9|nr:unnamed protein product [Priceomyces carsonii]
MQAINLLKSSYGNIFHLGTDALIRKFTKQKQEKMFYLSSLVRSNTFSVNFKLDVFRSLSHLASLKPNDGSVVGYKRLGRGPASGKGKTSGRGQKGQKARGSVPRWFEGGQTPFYKRFPIIGFKRAHKRIYAGVNLDRIQDFWNAGRIPLEEGGNLTMKVMKDCGIISGSVKDGVKILGNGKDIYTVPLNIESSKASIGAILSIERSGYKFTAKYFTKLGLKAHIDPNYFYLKKGYLPLSARPTHRRDVEYYSDPEKRGYLLKDRSILLDYLGKANKISRTTRKSELERLLENASSRTYKEFSSTRVIPIDML